MHCVEKSVILAEKNHIEGDDIFLSSEWIESPLYGGYSIGYGLETIFGPIEVKYNWSKDSNESGFYVNVGYWF